MALNTSKCSHLLPLCFKGLKRDHIALPNPTQLNSAKKSSVCCQLWNYVQNFTT